MHTCQAVPTLELLLLWHKTVTVLTSAVITSLSASLQRQLSPNTFGTACLLVDQSGLNTEVDKQLLPWWHLTYQSSLKKTKR